MNTLQNLYTLRDVVFPKVFELDKQGLVDLNTYESRCGTYRCLLGWHDYFTGTAEFSNKHFGIPSLFDEMKQKNIPARETIWGKLFGCGSSGGTLQDRYNYLCELIAEREKTEKVIYPNWIEMASKTDLVTEERMVSTQNNLQRFVEGL